MTIQAGEQIYLYYPHQDNYAIPLTIEEEGGELYAKTKLDGHDIRILFNPDDRWEHNSNVFFRTKDDLELHNQKRNHQIKYDNYYELALLIERVGLVYSNMDSPDYMEKWNAEFKQMFHYVGLKPNNMDITVYFGETGHVKNIRRSIYRGNTGAWLSFNNLLKGWSALESEEAILAQYDLTRVIAIKDETGRLYYM